MLRKLLQRHFENRRVIRLESAYRAWAENVIRTVPYGHECSSSDEERIRVECFVDRLAFALQTREIR